MKLELDNLYKHYGDLKVLDGVSLSLEDIHSLVFIGPSGGGKTTLLRLIAGLEKPDGGNILVNDRPIEFGSEDSLREYRKKIGMVFQAYNLFPHLTALENITLPLVKVHGYEERTAQEEALILLERFQLADQAFKKPAQLSGGQKQRIAICRAVAIRPEFLLLDEPTSALDPEYTSEVLDLIGELRAEGMRLILVTHEMGFARQAADYLLFVGDGGLIGQGTPAELFDQNADERVSRFFNKVLKYN
ncbi:MULTISPECIES: amino acid ABC transporter ATP-binding protein [unclassified Oceanispirochaeta]|uniref:amino acid ABC transporter ATP-binding protein n=1 Tax=unclassified Oceanispirochaeta TaxID=2635722 RepID=UPI000E099B48|nr:MULTISPECIES: amino acid ABC transporter ATP-binding protein [unclassified Oceanispirochaeta]MBF9016876.1 amino acid ABC transporter ATP-binding protein [Oceanispirochaeta sp. M2]NPD73239.1 amino acid ABC transporter ATP-binding protein [Oceanispirochaeta sp. M1]RDG31105.1 amino acid ABC transporter ATP-binding protein [Oceanispirochaeta sp. M1]